MSQKATGDSIIFSGDFGPLIPFRICAICTYVLVPGDYIVSRVVQNVSSVIPMFDTEEVHLGCIGVRFAVDSV